MERSLLLRLMPPRVGVAAVEVEVDMAAVVVATVVAAVVVTVVAGSPVGGRAFVRG